MISLSITDALRQQDTRPSHAGVIESLTKRRVRRLSTASSKRLGLDAPPPARIGLIPLATPNAVGQVVQETIRKLRRLQYGKRLVILSALGTSTFVTTVVVPFSLTRVLLVVPNDSNDFVWAYVMLLSAQATGTLLSRPHVLAARMCTLAPLTRILTAGCLEATVLCAALFTPDGWLTLGVLVAGLVLCYLTAHATIITAYFIIRQTYPLNQQKRVPTTISQTIATANILGYGTAAAIFTADAHLTHVWGVPLASALVLLTCSLVIYAALVAREEKLRCANYVTRQLTIKKLTTHSTNSVFSGRSPEDKNNKNSIC